MPERKAESDLHRFVYVLSILQETWFERKVWIALAAMRDINLQDMTTHAILIVASRTIACRRLENKWWDAVLARDAAHDGEFFFAVSSTGVYCRPRARQSGLAART